jgi:hypothetical protein
MRFIHKHRQGVAQRAFHTQGRWWEFERAEAHTYNGFEDRAKVELLSSPCPDWVCGTISLTHQRSESEHHFVELPFNCLDFTAFWAMWQFP